MSAGATRQGLLCVGGGDWTSNKSFERAVNHGCCGTSPRPAALLGCQAATIQAVLTR